MNWENDLRNNITTISKIESFINSPTKEIKLLKKIIKEHALNILKYYFSLINWQDQNNSIKKMLSGFAKRFRYIISHKTAKIEIPGILSKNIYLKYHQVKSRIILENYLIKL